MCHFQLILLLYRSKRQQPMLETALQILHFRSFLNVHGPLPQPLMDITKALGADPSPERLLDIEASEDYTSFMSDYTTYIEETLSGQHGSTAQFWMIYIKCVHVFLRFSRACRTNDFDLFTFSLGEMCPIFFATNRPIYSRWMVRYHIENTHPGVK